MSLLVLALQGLVAVVVLALSTIVDAQSTYRITELFSNQDGSIQFIRLTETAGLGGQNAFQNLAISVTYRGGTRQWNFPNDLPPTLETAHRDIIVGSAPVEFPQLGELPRFVEYTDCCIVVARADYAIPPNFLPTDGATIEFAGIDRITYLALPTDGARALFADQSVRIAEIPANAGCLGKPPSCPSVVHPTPSPITVLEYYNAARDHYFMTAFAPEIDTLDSGRLAGWQRTGESFRLGPNESTKLGLEYTYYGLGVCRFYILPDSHFFSGSADECAAVQSRFPDFVLETSAAFYAALPDPSTGQCAVMPGFVDGDIPLRPVFRLWNGRADTNHRYTTRADLRAAMIDSGWFAEGYGPLGVAFCVL